ncbi:MAG: hypothetical protein ABJA71_15380 [Ginsengibacter sp.]
MIYRFLLSILLFSLNSTVSGQSLQSMTWDTYKMKFKVPDNMTVQESDASGYQASNNSITLDIYPRKGENFTYDGMKNAIINWAAKTSLSYDSKKEPFYMKNLNGYWGCAIDGTKKWIFSLYAPPGRS